MADEAPKYARPEPAGFRLRVLNRNDLKLEDYYYLDYLLKPQPFVEKAAEAWNTRTPSPAQAGCRHCTCTCDNCAPCGEDDKQ